MRCLYFGDYGVQRNYSFGSKSIVTRQLVDVGLGSHEIRRPDKFLLVLDIELGNMNLARCIDLVLREVFVWYKLEHIDPARNLRTVDVTVVPIGRPLAAHCAFDSIHRPAIEIPDLNRMRDIG